MTTAEKALSLAQAETLANQIRLNYWHRDRFPVDPVTIGTELGIRIIDADLPEDVAGAFLKKVGGDPIIMLHEFDPLNRKRFTCAHELGHYVYRLERGHFDEQEIDHVDKRSELSSTGKCPEEISANRFAAALLMPVEKIHALLKDTGDIYALANFFKVSVSAMRYRLDSLGLLNND